MPGLSPAFQAFWTDVKYRVRYHSEFLKIMALGVGILGLTSFVLWAINDKNDQTMIRDAKQYHYTVGSTVLCNLSGYHDDEDNGRWIDCKIKSVSKDNHYYTTTFYSKDKHQNITYKFQIQYIGVKK